MKQVYLTLLSKKDAPGKNISLDDHHVVYIKDLRHPYVSKHYIKNFQNLIFDRKIMVHKIKNIPSEFIYLSTLKEYLAGR